ncbi:hypothetical protein AB0M22_45175 [Nocardia sp. NPDC051756]|uniref:hypothetical protein n=1 Tax=Nocardia sp. NPDC051756 TaxID=3154751 RepID=UPI003441C711
MSEREKLGAHVARMDRSLAEKTFEDQSPTSDARASEADQPTSRARLVGLLAVPALFAAAIAAWFIAAPGGGLAVRFYRFDVIPSSRPRFSGRLPWCSASCARLS